MTVTIQNMTTRPVMIRLNSGRTLYLGGSAVSEEIIEVEIVHNSRLSRLLQRGIIELAQVKKPAAATAGTGGEKRKSGKTKKANP